MNIETQYKYQEKGKKRILHQEKLVIANIQEKHLADVGWCCELQT